MALISDALMIAGALGAAFYCFVLSRRLRRFTDLERGVGGAVAVLSAQVDDMTKALKSAQSSADMTSGKLDGITTRAEDAARRLELLVASLHDLPDADAPKPPTATAQEGRDEQPANPDATLFFSQRGRIQEAAE